VCVSLQEVCIFLQQNKTGRKLRVKNVSLKLMRLRLRTNCSDKTILQVKKFRRRNSRWYQGGVNSQHMISGKQKDLPRSFFEPTSSFPPSPHDRNLFESTGSGEIVPICPCRKNLGSYGSHFLVLKSAILFCLHS
jgi:hypothetical protein